MDNFRLFVFDILTFRALLRREASRKLQRLVGERRQVEPVLVVVGDPRTGRHGQDSLAALHRHPEQFDRFRTQVSGTSVTQVAGHLI